MSNLRRQSNDSLETRLNDLETEQIPYQVRSLSTTLSVDTTDIASLRLNNLEIGKTYKLTMCAHIGSAAGSPGVLFAVHNGANMIKCQGAISAGGVAFTSIVSNSIVFLATSTFIRFEFDEPSDSTLIGDGTTANTFVVLEELPRHAVTTKWT